MIDSTAGCGRSGREPSSGLAGHGRHLESVLSDSRPTVLPGEGHTVFITHCAEILPGVTRPPP